MKAHGVSAFATPVWNCKLTSERGMIEHSTGATVLSSEGLATLHEGCEVHPVEAGVALDVEGGSARSNPSSSTNV